MIDRLWAMELFVRVAECGSFSRAAKSLGLANATITASVRNLERHLGATLISRNSRQLRLTAEGEALLPRARDLLRSVATIEEDIRGEPTALRGRLHVEVPISLGQALLSPALPEFARRHPQIETMVTLTNQPHNLIERAIDVAVRFNSVEDAQLVGRPVFEVQYVICGAPAMVGRLPAHPAQLDPRVCMGNLPEESSFPSAWELQRNHEKVVIQPQGPLHFNNAVPAMAAACSGVGIAYVLELVARPLLQAGSLALAYPEWLLPPRTYYLVTTRERANSAKVRAFADFLLELLDPARRASKHARIPVRPLHRR